MWNRRSGFLGFLVGTISYIREALLASYCRKRLLVYACQPCAAGTVSRNGHHYVEWTDIRKHGGVSCFCSSPPCVGV